ncbi:hypothetical protein ACIRJS_32855 [Streptomyces sp. NPDC102340]|uniref:hypothetical protein n=1 Tax=unclassified Streptomyces TaxID=2593676 RepID=UPI0037F9A91C
MTAEQLALDEADQDDDEPDLDEPDLPADLRGQRIPAGAHITDLHLTGSYL